MAGCSRQTKDKLSELPLHKGAAWVYAYEAYEPTASDPNQIVKATFQLTETVDDVKKASTYFIVHVEQESELVNADVGWTGNLFSQPKEFWYVVNDQQIFQSNQLINDADIRIDELTLNYEFPLSVKKAWCLVTHDPKDPKEIISCETIGRREVTNQGPYETLAGNFDDCYDLIDYFNGGNIFQKFCNGVGIVYMKFDHAGTRFGFEQTLIDYSPGVP